MKVFDFDGTLIDIWPRYYAVFCEAANAQTIAFAAYKKIKKRFQRDALVAEQLGVELPDNYFSRKKVLLEDENFLKLDVPLFSPDEIQAMLGEDAIILSKRRNARSFYQELDSLGIRCKSYILEQGDKIDWLSKLPSEGDNIMIGDSLQDLSVAGLPNYSAWMVGYGLNTYEQFVSTGIPFTYMESPVDLLKKMRERR